MCCVESPVSPVTAVTAVCAGCPLDTGRLPGPPDPPDPPGPVWHVGRACPLATEVGKPTAREAVKSVGTSPLRTGASGASGASEPTGPAGSAGAQASLTADGAEADCGLMNLN